MKNLYHALVALGIFTSLIFCSCQQEQNDELTLTLKKDEQVKKYSYWYKVSGTMTFTSTKDSTDTYDVSISNGNMYVSWTEDPNNKSNYKDYSINLYFDYYNKDSTEKKSESIINESIYGVNCKTYNSSSFLIDGNIESDSFSVNIDRGSRTYISSSNYYNAKIKLTCKKV